MQTISMDDPEFFMRFIEVYPEYISQISPEYWHCARRAEVQTVFHFSKCCKRLELRSYHRACKQNNNIGQLHQLKHVIVDNFQNLNTPLLIPYHASPLLGTLAKGLLNNWIVINNNWQVSLPPKHCPSVLVDHHPTQVTSIKELVRQFE